MKPILEIQNIGKKFMINHEQQPYLSLRDKLTGIFKSGIPKEEFWALKDVSFDVFPGESVGIIGKNGAGKSTLLKILSKITPPTRGKIISRGRIASLLEVGTGFHPELSGRENVLMNGSILGMRKVEILKNFDAIVDFAGVDRFIDTPLKHYSSGMQLRLAFAVAAFLENEILIIDEVLAVGDAEFQKKCLGKMQDISQNEGKTVVFVSHDLNAVNKLCDNSIILQNGSVTSYGITNEIISEYIHGNSHKNSWKQEFNLSKEVYFESIEVSLKGKQPNLVLEVFFKLKKKSDTPVLVAFNVSNQMGQYLGQAMPTLSPINSYSENTCKIFLNNIVPDEYYLGVWVGPNLYSTFDWQKEIVSFKIMDAPQEGRVQYGTDFGMLFLDSELKNFN